MGIVINREKLDLMPKQQVKYQGMLIDLAAEKTYPIDSRVSKLREVTAQFLSWQEKPAQL